MKSFRSKNLVLIYILVGFVLLFNVGIVISEDLSKKGSEISLKEGQKKDKISKWTLNNEFQFSLNPLGIQDIFQLKNKIKLFNTDDFLFENSYVSFGIIDVLSPAYNYIGGQIEIEPIAFFDIKLRGFFIGYTSFYGLYRLSGYDVDYSDEALSNMKATTEIGWHVQIIPTLKLQVGPVVAANNLNLFYFKQYISDYFYEPYADLLLFNEDWALQNNLIVGYEIKLKEDKKDALIIGVLHQYAFVVGSKSFYEKIGPFVSWTISNEWAGMLNPTLFVSLNYYLHHPSRKDTFYFVLTYAFDFDF